MNRRRYHPAHRRSKAAATPDDPEHVSSQSEEIFSECEKLKQKILSLPNGKPDIWHSRQELLDQYGQLFLTDLDYALEKKIEHDLWTVVFKNEISSKQEQLKENSQHPTKRAEIQASLQTLYEYARGYYMKLLQDVVQSYHFSNSICKLTFSFLRKQNSDHPHCKEASILYFLQHILVHVGDLHRYSNQIDLAKTFYQYAIQTIPCLGQPYNQIAIIHEMKNPLSLLTPEENQLITVYYYIRSIAIKVPFPLAISNLEKLFQRLKDFPLTRYDQPTKEFLALFLQIIAMINLEFQSEQIPSFIQLFQTLIIKHFNQTHFLQMMIILMFTIHRTLGLLPRSAASKQPDLQFDLVFQVFILIIEQCFEGIQVPLSVMIIEEQHILPVLYLSFAYLANIQKSKEDLFEHQVFKQKQSMWNALAKLLRSFGVHAASLETPKDKNLLSESLLIKYADYPLVEERTLECFTPLNDVLKGYNFKKYDNEEYLSEKDERQLRKLRLVSILRNLCQKVEEKSKKKVFDYLLTYVRGDLVCFESSSPTIQQIPSSSFGVPGDRRTTQKSTMDDSRSTNPNGSSNKTPRGIRNVALRQFLEPALTALESASNDQKRTSSNNSTSFPPPPPHLQHQLFTGPSDAWPRLSTSSEPKNSFQQQQQQQQQQPVDYESRLDSVWNNNDDSKDQFSFQSQTQPILAPGSMFSNPLAKNNSKSQQPK